MYDYRDLWNNGFVKLFYTERTSYNESTPHEDFTEFTYNNKPLAVAFSEITRMVNDVGSTTPFINDVFITLQNQTIKSFKAIDDIRETTFYSSFAEQGIDLKTDYVFRLYLVSAGVKFPLFTGVAYDVEELENTVKMTLRSRVGVLADLDGIDNLTDLAGWLENYEFETALKSILSNCDVEYTGDTNGIDYLQTTSERSIDVKSFIDSTGIYTYSDNEIIISNKSVYDSSKYGTRYNYVSNTIESFGLDNIVHFTFTNSNNEIYHVVEKHSEIAYRIGQYTKLYVQADADPNDITYIGVGKAPEVLNKPTNDKLISLFGSYVEDRNIDNSTDIELIWADSNYHYYETSATAESFLGFVGQVIDVDGYYAPLFSLNQSAVFSNSQIPTLTIFSNDTTLYTNFVGLAGADVNTLKFDTYKGYDTETSPLSRLKQEQASKSRSYFLFDVDNNRLIFQAASKEAPNSTSVDIDGKLTKSWNNFGLNPIAYYDFDVDDFDYLDENNNDFIQDWVFTPGTIYATTVKPYNMDYTETTDVNTTYELITISSVNGTKNILKSNPIINGFVGYGLNFYNYLSEDYISFVYKGDTNYNHEAIKISDSSSDVISVGDITNYATCTGSIFLVDRPILIIFKNQQLQYTDIYNQGLNVLYPNSTMSSDKLGGYLLLSPNSTDFTGKFEDFVLASTGQVRGRILDMSDLNLMQSLIQLSNMANKSMFINEYDVLNFANEATINANSTTLSNLTSCVISDIEDYNKVNLNQYIVDSDDVFKWEVAGDEYENKVLGKWYGADASFILFIDVIDATTLDYYISSASSILETPKTTINDVDWGNIQIDFGDDFLIVKFVDADEVTPVTPSNKTDFTLVFNSKKLKKMNVPAISEDSSSTTKKTKTINNRFVSPQIAPLLLNDIDDNFLGKKNNYEPTSAYPIFDLNLLQVCYLTYYHKRIENQACRFRGTILSNTGKTKILLKEK